MVMLLKEKYLRRAQGNITIISSGPRYIIEGVVFFGVALLAFYFSETPHGASTIIPIIGTFMIAFQKCLPLVQASFACITFIKGGKNSLVDVLQFQTQLGYECNTPAGTQFIKKN